MPSAGEDRDESRALIARCVAGDEAASRQFQETYGELVYGFPLRVYRVPVDEAGDFYVFAFEEGRIYRRLRTFEGRAPLRAYLLGFVLDDLVLEWKRREHILETVSLDDIGEISSAPLPIDASGDDSRTGAALADALGSIDPCKAVVFKLLHAEDCDLSDMEVRHIAKVSGRSVAATLDAVDELRAGIRERESTAREIDENLESVQSWIQLYERRVAQIHVDLTDLPPRASRAERLRAERSELERKLANRRRQRAKLAGQVQRRKVTAPYKEIATVLNTSIGNVGSQITRIREELGKAIGGRWLGGSDPKRKDHQDDTLVGSLP